MKTLHLSALLLMMCLLPSRLTASELEDLRARCKQQEQQIQELQAQIRSLKGEPTPTPRSKETPKDSTPTPSAATYTVTPGDSIEKIARTLGCAPSALAEANQLTLNSVIRPGQKLQLPQGVTHTASTPTPSPTSSPTTKSYKIQEGETYFSVARKLGVPLEKLIAANPQIKASQLYAGRMIQVPTSTAEAPSRPAEAPKTPVAEKPAPAPASTPASPAEESATTQTTPPAKKIRLIKIDSQITYGAFAAKHGTDVKRLNDLNGIDLTSTTELAKGSELYVPSQP